MNKYDEEVSSLDGYFKIIAYKKNEDDFIILYSEVTQFDHSIPDIEPSVEEYYSIKEESNINIHPYSWLQDLINATVKKDLPEIFSSCEIEVENKQFFEICSFVNISNEIKSESGNELGLEYYNVSTRTFQLKDLKGSFFYHSKEIANWISQTRGLKKGEDLEKLTSKLVKEGYSAIQ